MDAWNDVAYEYHRRVEPFTSQFLPFLLNRNFLVERKGRHVDGTSLNYLNGKHVLDVATGTGAAALYAASKGAKVTATDFSEEMLKIADARSCRSAIFDDSSVLESPGMTFETRLADGENLPAEWTDKFDITCSNFGVIYFSNVDRGIEEMTRCTKAGGKVCISAWARREMTNAFRIFPAAVKQCGFEDKWKLGSSEMSFFRPTRRISADKDLLYDLLHDAKLKDVKVIGPFPREMRLSSAEEYWYRFVLGCPNVKRMVKYCFTEEERRRLKEAVIQLVHEETFDKDTPQAPASPDIHSTHCHDISCSSFSTTKIKNIGRSKVAIADSGATHHLWPDYSAFVSYKRVSNKFVSLADKSTAPIRGIGDIAVSLGGKKVLIRDVYHVPSLKAPLYSLGAHRRLPGCGFAGNNDSFQIEFPDFSLTIHDDVDSYIKYHPLGRTSKKSFDYIEPRPNRHIARKRGYITLCASAFIAVGTK
jgi:SAM-dependent methyltransferase